MINLYGRGQSRSFRALWALEEAKLPFEYTTVTAEMVAATDYKALNFQRKIPTLVDGDLVLTESAAIINYVAAKSAVSLIPNDVALRAQYDDLCYFVMTDFEQPLWTIGKHRFALPEEQRCEAVVKTAVWEFAKSQRALMQRMAGRTYAVGEQFSMADVLLGQTIGWARRFEMDVEKELVAYQELHYARPACVASLEKVADA